MTTLYSTIAESVAGHGLLLRGGFYPVATDTVPVCAHGQPALTVLMIGNGGRAMWDTFAKQRSASAHPLDDWTHAVIDGIARRYGARPVYPYDAPPLPFQRWASRAWPVSQSPLGLLIDAKYGLWHALRAALLFPDKLELPEQPATASPCASCAEKPCLTACPIGAFTTAGFDYIGCREYLTTQAGEPCLDGGCQARVACPVGAEHRYPPAQLQFHMQSFSGIRRRT